MPDGTVLMWMMAVCIGEWFSIGPIDTNVEQSRWHQHAYTCLCKIAHFFHFGAF